MTDQALGGTWEEAVRWYRLTATPEEIQANYFDLPVLNAARRYSMSREFRAVRRILRHTKHKRVLDLGAGNGIASYAFATNGWAVEAVEPDGSDEVGAGAIRKMAQSEGLDIRVHQSIGETLPLSDDCVGAVHARQVLHHLSDLGAGLKEMARILLPGGLALCTREHVADDQVQLESFLARHPLHFKYGGENAYPLNDYLGAAIAAGFKVARVWGPYETGINVHEMSAYKRTLLLGARDGRELLREPLRVAKVAAQLSWRPVREAALARDASPGRLYSFLLRKDFQ